LSAAVTRKSPVSGVVDQVLDHQCVDVDQGRLDDPQALNAQLLLVGPVGRQFAGLAVVADANANIRSATSPDSRELT
jgi:hypothetical protein